MSKTLKWIVGIGAVLLVAVCLVLAVAPLFLARMGVAGFPMLGLPGRMFGFGPNHMFGMVGRGLPFFGLFGLFALARLIWPLLIVALVVWALMTLMRPRPQMPYASSAPMASTPMSPVPPAPMSQATCPNCGQPLQAGWRHCPNCGQPIAQPGAG